MHKSELQETSPEVLEQVLATNLLGSIYGARAALQVTHRPVNLCVSAVFPSVPLEELRILFTPYVLPILLPSAISTTLPRGSISKQVPQFRVQICVLCKKVHSVHFLLNARVFLFSDAWQRCCMLFISDSASCLLSIVNRACVGRILQHKPEAVIG